MDDPYEPGDDPYDIADGSDAGGMLDAEHVR